MKIPAKWRPWIAVLVAVVFAATGYVVDIDDNNGTIRATVKGPTGPTSVVVPKETVEKIDETLPDKQAVDETPTGITGKQVKASTAQFNRFAARDKLPATQPEAAPSQPGCKSNFVQAYSSRHGTKPRWIVSHFTAGPNLPGFRDIDALTAYSNNLANGVSWTYNVDREGHCAYTVRETDKPWTQAAANRVSIGIEIVNRGAGDGPLFTDAGLKRYARIVSDSARRWDIPIRRGKANKSTCTVIRSGLIDHNDLGVCGGNHFDIKPYDVNKIIVAVHLYRVKVGVTHRRCAELKRLRDRARWRKNHDHSPAWLPARTARAQKLKAALGPKAASCR